MAVIDGDQSPIMLYAEDMDEYLVVEGAAALTFRMSSSIMCSDHRFACCFDWMSTGDYIID